MPRRRASSAVASDKGAARRQGFGSQHMRRQIAVAELEPGRAAELLHRCHEIPGLAGESPTAFRIVPVGKGIEHRVDVGRDVQAEMDEIVGGVDGDGKLFGRQHGDQAAGKLAAADATCQCKNETLVGHGLLPEQVDLAGTDQVGGRSVRVGKVESA